MKERLTRENAVATQDSNIAGNSPDSQETGSQFDYTHIDSIARVALYDDLRAAPRVTEIQPAETTAYIEKLASTVYEQSKLAGGTIPYTAIREVSENFIHAKFSEVIVSILDNGNTIRFADQGPGIAQKDKAQLPGFSSAIEPMKRYIRGVGSGLPIVKEYLDFSHGSITIEDNLNAGSVVTISMNQEPSQPEPMGTAPAYPQPQVQPRKAAPPMPVLTDREKSFLPFFLYEGALGVTDLMNLTGTPQSSTYVTLQKLQEAGLVEKTTGQKRILTDYGYEVANSLQ